MCVVRHYGIKVQIKLKNAQSGSNFYEIATFCLLA